jgi:hypothetical protein
VAHLRSSDARLLGKRDTGRDEQRGVAVVLSPRITEDPLSSLRRCDAHRVDGVCLISVWNGDQRPPSRRKPPAIALRRYDR